MFVSGVTERMSMGIEVPERPRNCERAAFRCVRAVRGSGGVALVAVEVLGWWILWGFHWIRLIP